MTCKGDITISAAADINVPEGVPLIGGDTLLSLNFYLQYRPGNNANSFVAAWTTFLGHGIGFEYNFDDHLTIIYGPPSQATAAAAAAATPPETLTVTNSQASGTGSLAAAISQANSYASSSTIHFAAGVSSIQLASSLAITTSQSVTITGPGASQLAISGNNGTQVFNVASGANVDISGLTIEDGKAAMGGGLSNSGNLLLSNDALSDNTATSSGGGIYNTGTLTLSSDVLSHNTATKNGGGIYNTETLMLNGGNIIGNSAKNGGGIWNSGALALSNCLVYLNILNPTSGLGGGIFSSSTIALDLSNSTVADNNYTGGTTLPLTVVDPDIDGTVDASSSNNIIGDGSGMIGITNKDANNNQVGTASNPINPFTYTVNVSTDNSPSHTGTGSGLTGDLRYCVNKANSAAGQGFPQTIQFASGLDGQTIILTEGGLGLTSGTGATTINGGGEVTISGSGTTVLHVNAGATAVFTGLTISNGQGNSNNYEGAVSSAAGGIFNQGTLTLIHCTISHNSAGFSGAGIENLGTLTLTDSTVSGNNCGSGFGGGISNLGTLSVSSSTISGNHAGVGGGIYTNGDGGSLTLSSSTISSNSAANGGGIYNSGRLSVSSSTISSNNATDGGGIYSDSSIATLSSSTIAHNSAASGGGISNGGTACSVSSSTFAGNTGFTSGGGLYNTTSANSHISSNLTLNSSTISANNATDGGGIFNATSGTLTLSSSTISGNSSNSGGGIHNSGTLTVTEQFHRVGQQIRDLGSRRRHLYNNLGIASMTASNVPPSPPTPPGLYARRHLQQRRAGDSLTLNNTIVAGNSGTLMGFASIDSDIVHVFSNTSSLSVGMLVTGAGIPPGDTIVAIPGYHLGR